MSPLALTRSEADSLAVELLHELTAHAGNPVTVRATVLGWLDDLDLDRLSLVCTAAVELIFADCLSPVPIDHAPPGALALTPQPTPTTSKENDR